MARGTRPTRISPHTNRPVIVTSIFHSPIPMNHVASPEKNCVGETFQTFFWWVSEGSRQTAYFGTSKSLSQVARGVLMVITIICCDVVS
jgi:hypothetical protein